MLIAERAKAKPKRRYPASWSFCDRKPARVFLASDNRPAQVVARRLRLLVILRLTK
jgi:hypothetical protein